MIRVAHLLDTDGFAGTERHVLQLVRGLSSAGAAPLIACRPDTPLCQRAKAASFDVWPGLGARPGVGGLLRLLHFVRREGIELIHAHNGRTSLTAALLTLASPVPCVMTQHFISPAFAARRGPTRAAAHAAHRWVNRRIARVCCISDATRDAMIEREGASPDKLITVRNGVEALPPITDDQRAALRRSLVVAENGMLIVCVARLEPEKGHEVLLDALPAVRGAHPGTRVALVGEGSTRPALESHARAVGVAGGVAGDVAGGVVFTGFREDAAALTAACDLFVLPSPAEPFGLAIVEAMSCGKPVIACRAGGPLEIIEEGQTGLLVPPGDSAALAAAIVRLLGDAALRERLGAAARTAFQERFTADRMARDTLEVYRGVLAEGGESRTDLGFGARSTSRDREGAVPSEVS